MTSQISRRRYLRTMGGMLGCASMSGWLPLLTRRASAGQRPHRACIVLWMQGGPAQTDTFDMKPGSKSAGEFRPISTAAPDIEICQHLPRLARQMGDLAIIRSMQTKEGDHGRATSLLHTGYAPTGPVKYPRAYRPISPGGRGE